MKGNPNALNEGDWPGVQTGMRWMIGLEDFTAQSLGELKRRCTFWREIAGNIPI
jgi:hypothetical protein